MARWLVLSFALLWSGAAWAAPDRLTLGPDETVEVMIAADGKMRIGEAAAAAAMNAFDRKALAELVRTEVPTDAGVLPPQIVSRDAGDPVLPVTPGMLRITLRDVPGKSPHERLLVIENGYGKALRYKAVLRKGDRAKPTDVCWVLPGKRSYEHWPYTFDQIELSALTLVDWQESDGIPCE